jgi:sugar lactone lactonase YvrE
VADTWNHRVQHFDANGTFLGKWGRLGDTRGSATSDPGVFWGPRAIAISPQGEVYVTDTGNKRVQVFTLDGTFVRMFGGEGSDPGQFHEDVGITLDSQGNVWVADAWNRRIQELDPNGKPLAQISVPSGWDNQSITNKPYIALNAQGQIVVSVPDQGKTITFSRDGQLVSQTQLPGQGTPVGVAAGPGGKLLFADARNNVVVQTP